ncbi:hypothetical protein CRENPOLYSF1_150074 [Crenothrix polyspora]|uniref:Uncharacterized protein n=1 Tax=Crenothrix polyspora TaxID=360316 RepID=A0A1R4H3L5_9GAMM|nr:hypothetical protein CRENPOLYSF1_150074 [Crenothrix polyspora]
MMVTSYHLGGITIINLYRVILLINLTVHFTTNDGFVILSSV